MIQQRYSFVGPVTAVSLICAIHVSYFVDTEASVESLFSSLPKIKILWHNELKNIRLMEKIIVEMESPPKEIEAYVKSHYIHRLNQTPNYDYLGHPLNSYHLIRHIASGWNTINSSVLKNEAKDGHIDYFKKLNIINNEPIPDIDDVIGGAAGIVKLWAQYRINLNELMRNGKIVAIMENGKHVESEPSAVKINAFDLATMVTEARRQQLYYASAVFSKLLVKQAKKEHKQKINNYENLWNFTISPRKAELILSQAELSHDRTLEKKGPVGLFHQCNYKPINRNMTIKKEHLLLEFRDRKTVAMFQKLNHRKFPQLMEAHHIALNNYTNKLCNGGHLSNADQRANLRCHYYSSNSSWLKLGPFRIEINAYDPFHVTIKQLVFVHECDEITSNNTHKLMPYPGKKKKFHEHIPWTDVRKMQNVRINENDSVVYDKVTRRIEHFTNLRANTTKGEAEEMFAGAYGIGGDYWAHVDFTGDERSGDRLATICTLLDAPKAGGATIFPYAGTSAIPEKGDGALWYNLLKRGIIDNISTHSACPVLIGNKFIANKWIGYNSQGVGTTKCGLFMNDRLSLPNPISIKN